MILMILTKFDLFYLTLMFSQDKWRDDHFQHGIYYMK